MNSQGDGIEERFRLPILSKDRTIERTIRRLVLQ